MIAGVVFFAVLIITAGIIGTIKLIPKIQEYKSDFISQKAYESRALNSNEIIYSNIEAFSDTKKDKTNYTIKGDNEKYL